VPLDPDQMSPSSGKAFLSDKSVAWWAEAIKAMADGLASNNELVVETVDWDGEATVARVEVPLREGSVRPVLVAVDNAPTEGVLPGQAKDLVVTFEHLVGTELVEAQAVIGIGDNGQVLIEVIIPGPAGLEYSVEVDASLDEQTQTLVAALIGKALTVKLATEGAVQSGVSIGTGQDGTVEILVTEPGSEGDAYGVLVDADLEEQDRPLAAVLEEKELTVSLATKGDAAAGASIGSGDNGTVDIEAAAEGSEGNDFTAAVDASLAEDRVLSAELVENALLVKLAVDTLPATAAIGSGENGAVAIAVVIPGEGGNACSVEVTAALVEQDKALAVTLEGTALLVELATEGDVQAGATIGSGENGEVAILVTAPGSDGNLITAEVDADLVEQDRPLSAALVVNALLVELATEGDSPAYAAIGTGENGGVDVVALMPGTEGNDFTVEVNADLDEVRALSAELVGANVLVKLATEELSAGASIGSGENGAVAIAVVAPGEAGDDYTVEVDADLAAVRALDASLVADALLIELAVVADAKATASIGSGENGTVDLEVDAPGPGGNDLTVEVDADLATQDRPLAAALVVNALLVELATEGDEPAEAVVGSGENGQVTISVVAPGSDGNDYGVEADGDLATQDRPLAAALLGDALTIELATRGLASAVARIGEDTHNWIDTTVDAEGTDGNDWTIEVVLGVGNNVAMSVALVGTDLVVTLGTDAEGDPDFGKNLASLVVIAITAKAGVTAAAVGAGDHPLDAAEGPTQFADGTNELDPVANTATLVAAEVAGVIEFGAVASGTGAAPLTAAEGPTQFADGTNKLDVLANTATLVAAELETVPEFNAAASGDGTSPLTAAEGPTQFENGSNALDAAANTATLVGDAIDLLGEFACTPSGTGASPLTVAEGPTQFDGGGIFLDASANTATLVAGAIDLLADIEAVPTGTGADPLTAAEGPTPLANGTNKLDVVANTATLVAGVIDALEGFEATPSGTGVDPLTAAEGPTQFADGTNKLDGEANSAQSVAWAINAVGDPTVFFAVQSGEGNAPLTVAEGPTDFEGGGVFLIADENTATLVAEAISALPAFTATATGGGGDSLDTTEGPTPLVGGTNQLDDAANTAHLVAAEVDALPQFEAADTGTGLDPLTAAQVLTSFIGGENQLLAAANTATLVAAAIDAITGSPPVFHAEPTGSGEDSLTEDEGPTQFSGGATAAEIWMPWMNTGLFDHHKEVEFQADGSTRRVYGPFTGFPLFLGGRVVLTAAEAPAAGTRTVVYVRTA